MKKLIPILFAFLYMALASAGISQAAQVGFLPVMGVFITAYAITAPVTGVFAMGVQKEVWVNDIVEHIYMTNEWLKHAIDHDSYVIGGKVVHVPYAGDKPIVEKNRTTYPMTVLRRDDTDSVYVIDEFSSNPIAIPHADTVELSYDKRNSVLMNTKNVLSEVVGHEFLYNWSPTLTAQIIRTTGTAVAAHSSGATGNRKKILVSDVSDAKTKFDEAGVPEMGRFMILDSRMYKQLSDDLKATQYRDVSVLYDGAKGRIKELEGFTIYQRAYVMRYTNDATPVRKTFDAVSATTDNAAALCWYMGGVARALGEHNFFENIADATYQADIYSALIRAGGKKWLQDEIGSIAIVQAATT